MHTFSQAKNARNPSLNYKAVDMCFYFLFIYLFIFSFLFNKTMCQSVICNFGNLLTYSHVDL